MTLFDNSTSSLTTEQQVTKQIDSQLKTAATTLKRAYTSIRGLIYNNPRFMDEYGAFLSDDVYAAFATYTQTGLSPDDLGKAARLIKATINQFAPGTIVDEVPEATITY